MPMKQFLLFSGTALCVCASGWQVHAQSADNNPTATITFANNQSVVAQSDGRSFNQVGLLPNAVVGVAVQFSSDQAGQVLNIESPDGGVLPSRSNTATIGSDGILSFSFQAGSRPGAYQVVLHNGTQEVILQFWTLDLQNPQNNPPTATSQ
jgi:hypothetical protein